MKKLTLIILSFLTFNFGFSQKLEKYADALPKILALPSSGIPASLRIYQIDDPENASIYFQMGVVYYERFQNSDILTDYKYKIGNARKVLLNMTTAKSVVTEKDVKRNDEHYLNFGGYDSRGRLTVSFDTISNYISSSMEEVNAFINNAPPVYESFSKSFTHYDRAHKLYTELLGQYPTLNDLMLLYNEDMEKIFSQIESEYQNSIESFEKYKAATDSFPINYDQQLKIEPLNVYRLDGLSSEINFLNESIHIWDYATWVANTRAYIKANIDALRLELMKEDQRINEAITSAQSDYIREAFEPLEVTKETLFTLRKFDLQSVIEPIFLYKEAKHDIFHSEFQSRDLEEAEEADLSRKLFVYGEVVNKIQDADTLLLNIKSRNTDDTHAKYPQFLSVNYKGKTGIDQFAASESAELRSKESAFVNKLIDGIYESIEDSVILPVAKFKRTEIPVVPKTILPADTISTNRITTHRLKNFDGSSFISGIYRDNDSLLISYVSGITPDGKVGWYNEYKMALDSGRVPSHNFVAAMTAIPGGCALIINVSSDSVNESQNQLVLLDEGGEVRVDTTLTTSYFPRKLFYNDRNNSLLITFTGAGYFDDILQSQQLVVEKYNMLGQKIWVQSITGRLSVVGVTNTIEGYILTGNYSQYRSPTGEMMRAGRNTEDVGIYLLSISNDGEITNMKPVESDEAIYAVSLFKVSADCINIIGNKGSYEFGGKMDAEVNDAFIMIDRDMVEVVRKI